MTKINSINKMNKKTKIVIVSVSVTKIEKMKIAIASEGKDKDSRISEKGGRAPYYLIFEDKKLIETIKNPFALGGGGAGFSVAYMLAEKDVKLVIAGKVAENMVSALKEKGINFRKESNKKIEEVV